MKHFKVHLFIYMDLERDELVMGVKWGRGICLCYCYFFYQTWICFRVQPLLGRAYGAISQMIWYWMLLLFSSQMCLESSVHVSMLLFLNVAVWLFAPFFEILFYKLHKNIAYLWKSLWNCCFLESIHYSTSILIFDDNCMRVLQQGRCVLIAN